MKKPFDQSKRKPLYEFIVKFFCDNHYPPSLVEMSKATGIKSTSHVRYYLNQLIEDGLVKRIRRGQSRGIIPVGVKITPPREIFIPKSVSFEFTEDMKIHDSDNGKTDEIEVIGEEGG